MLITAVQESHFEKHSFGEIGKNVGTMGTLNEKIQEQAMKVIGEYNAFKDKGGKAKDFFSRRGGSGNSSKLELVSE